MPSLLHFLAVTRWQAEARPKQFPPSDSNWFVWLIRTGRGFGKALALDTALPTLDGWTTIKDVEVGDILFDERGCQCRVTSTSIVHLNRPCFKMVFDDHSEIVADADHEWLCWNKIARKAYGRAANPRTHPRTKTTLEMSRDLYVSNGREVNYSIDVADALQIPSSVYTIHPYVLGYWLGNGSSSSAEVTCHVDDLVELSSILDSYGAPITGKLRFNESKAVTFTIGGLSEQNHRHKQTLQFRLRHLGLLNNKYIPNNYLRGSKDQRMELLKGLMDSDGHARPGGHLEFCNTNKLIAESAFELIVSLGFKPVYSTNRAMLNGRDCGPKYRIHWTAKVPVFNLARKAKVLCVDTAQANRIRHRYIVDIQPVESVPVKCLTVDSESRLFLAGKTMIPTHNTRSITEWLDTRARLKKSGEQVLLAGRTPSDVRDYTLQGPGGLLHNHKDVQYFPSKRLLLWPNGVEGLIRSGANPEEFRGFSGDTAALDEFAAWDYPEESWNNLIFGMREGNPQIAIGTTPKPISILRQIAAMPTTVLVTGSSYENRANLSDKYVTAVLDPLAGTTLGRREIEGLDTDDAEGALWTRALITNNRVSPSILSGPNAPELSMVAVGVDPQGKKGLQNDQHDRETGIVCCALCVDQKSKWHGHFFVLDDASLNGTPKEWGEAVVTCYNRNQADVVVAEVNFGGDMVQHNIEVVDPNVPVKVVTASRGKVRRAEPVVAKYEKGLVHHVGVHGQLEDEMCNWLASEKWSPNRLDALVWAITDLMEAGKGLL